MTCRAVVLCVCAGACLASCSSQPPARHSTAAVPEATVPAAHCPRGLTTTQRNPGLTMCSYRSTNGPCHTGTVSINTAPQALVDFDRWSDEAVQNATVQHDPAGSVPSPVPGVGTLADWVPATRTFAAATKTPDRWVTVRLAGCRGAADDALPYARRLATAALRTH